jgi:hypothetical protein
LLCCGVCGCSSAGPAPARVTVVCYGPDDPELDGGQCVWPAPDAGSQSAIVGHILKGYSPDAPLPSFDCWRPLVRSETRSARPQSGGRPRKWPMPEVGTSWGCYAILGLSWARQGRSDLAVRVRCECGVTEEVFEFNLRKRLTRSDRCPHTKERVNDHD